MRAGLLGRDVLELRTGPSAERATRRGEDQSVHLGGRPRAQTLCDRGVLGVDRDDLPGRGGVEEDVDQVAMFELGLGRPRVLSGEGREVAATRWYDGENGPSSETAKQAPAPCVTCGYFVPMSGVLRQVFGVCANEWSPSDGTVVSLDHGCGAHSEVDAPQPEPESSSPRSSAGAAISVWSWSWSLGGGSVAVSAAR